MRNLSRTTVYHSRISLVKTVFDYSEKSESKLSNMISTLIKEDKVNQAITSDFGWHFGDVIEFKTYIHCKLGKIRKKKQKTLFDNTQKKFIEIESNEEDAIISHILFDKKTHFFLFEERPEVGYKELIYVITEAIRKIYDREIHIDILPNNLEVTRILKDASKITKARFLLQPSNPDNSADLRKMDELIRDIRAKKAKMEFVNDDGLDHENSKTFKSALSLSNRGFGTFNLDYEYSDGTKHKFSSKKKQLRETMPKPTSDESWKKKLIELLNNTINLLNKK
ncbi:MAG: hypothetical protein KKF65_02810 [Nanoarchaeota archaeon]|nr:hypothetical protein [Nanoarchaeota archaeon]